MTRRARIHLVTIACLFALAASLAACEFTPIPPPDAAPAGIDNAQSNEGVLPPQLPSPNADIDNPEELTLELAALCEAIPNEIQGLLLESPVDYVDRDRFQVVGPAAVLTDPAVVESTINIITDTVGESFVPDPDGQLVLGNINVEASEGNLIVTPAQDGIEMATWVIPLNQAEIDESIKERKLNLQFDVIEALNDLYNEQFGSEPRLCATLVPSIGHLEGQPHSGRGGPFGSGAHEVDRLSFDKQWAFKPVTGIDWVDVSIPATKTVNVGVFDSSPLNPGQISETVSVSLTIMGSGDTLEFTAIHQDLGTVSRTGVITAPDHGLSTLMLVHQIAPDSNLSLYQIMNYDMVASLWDVLLAVMHFQSLHPPEDEISVINLSLGVPRELMDTAIVNDGLLPLWITLAYHRLKGGVIVASAGNDFIDGALTNKVQPPALWRFAIGVSASTNIGEKACYAQHSDSVIFAPGGDGDPVTSGICPSKIDECTLDNMGDCEHGIVSMTIDHPGDGSEIPPLSDYPQIAGMPGSLDYPNWPTTYYYWSGTSFSAPMVTGLVARILEAGVPREELKYILWGCAHGNPDVPIIDVGKTLTAIQVVGADASTIEIITACRTP